MALSDEQRLVREQLREFVDAEVRERARVADRQQSFPEDLWDELAELGFTGLTVPAAYGGLDTDQVTDSLVNEELARGDLSLATALSVHSLATSCIRQFGTEHHRERWLPAMAEGRPVGAFALSEQHAGSNPRAMHTEATRDGDEYVLNGTKQWITNGERSGVVILFAKTDRDDPNTVTQFLVPKETAGVSVGKKEDKLGLRASDTTTLVFDGARIPAENRLTPVGEGLKAALSTLTDGRIAIASQAVGVGAAALAAATEYATDHKEGGEQPIERQAVAHTLAEMQTRVQAARLLARDAARKNDGDVDPVAASMAKYFASETAVAVTSDALQLHAHRGYTTASDVERYFRDAKVTTIYEGTTEIQKELISRHLRRE